MAQVVRDTAAPERETVVVDRDDREPRSNAGTIIAIIVLIILILIVFGGVRLFRGGGTTNVNVPAPTNTGTSPAR